jgi:hypothetical protein
VADESADERPRLEIEDLDRAVLEAGKEGRVDRRQREDGLGRASKGCQELERAVWSAIPDLGRAIAKVSLSSGPDCPGWTRSRTFTSPPPLPLASHMLPPRFGSSTQASA